MLFLKTSCVMAWNRSGHLIKTIPTAKLSPILKAIGTYTRPIFKRKGEILWSKGINDTAVVVATILDTLKASAAVASADTE